VSEIGVIAKQPSPAADASRRPDRRPGQTIGKLLDAGREELRNTAYADMTMRAVATRAGVSSASAYKYFPSKAALVAAIYLRLLRTVQIHTNVNDTTKTRVSATMRDMALVAADEPDLINAFTAAVMADDPAVGPLRQEIASEVAKRISAALGPGWSHAVKSTLQLTFSGALMTAHFLTYDQIAEGLEDAVHLILGASVA